MRFSHESIQVTHVHHSCCELHSANHHLMAVLPLHEIFFRVSFLARELFLRTPFCKARPLNLSTDTKHGWVIRTRTVFADISLLSASSRPFPLDTCCKAVHKYPLHGLCVRINFSMLRMALSATLSPLLSPTGNCSRMVRPPRKTPRQLVIGPISFHDLVSEVDHVRLDRGPFFATMCAIVHFVSLSRPSKTAAQFPPSAYLGQQQSQCTIGSSSIFDQCA